MRGEKAFCSSLASQYSGSSPHARGKDGEKYYAGRHDRIIPACAGKRLLHGHADLIGKDHPRMRGEKQEISITLCLLAGSSPHARGKVLFHLDEIAKYGIIPACAGKSVLCDNKTVYQ